MTEKRMIQDGYGIRLVEEDVRVKNRFAVIDTNEEVTIRGLLFSEALTEFDKKLKKQL
tara:strand:- start:5429 stop:5602 length:174 start_codon:yes stop_codon:yes gene_type:complete